MDNEISRVEIPDIIEDSHVALPPTETTVAVHENDATLQPEDVPVFWLQIQQYAMTAAPVVGAVLKIGLGIVGTFYPPAAALLVAETAAEKLFAKEPMPTTDTNLTLPKIIGLLIGVLGIFHILPASLATPEAQQAIGEAIVAVVGVVHIWQSGNNKQATAVALNATQATAVAASKTSQGLDADGHPITNLTATAQ